MWKNQFLFVLFDKKEILKKWYLPIPSVTKGVIRYITIKYQYGILLNKSVYYLDSFDNRKNILQSELCLITHTDYDESQESQRTELGVMNNIFTKHVQFYLSIILQLSDTSFLTDKSYTWESIFRSHQNVKISKGEVNIPFLILLTFHWVREMLLLYLC